jgi:hypothetical protein
MKPAGSSADKATTTVQIFFFMDGPPIAGTATVVSCGRGKGGPPLGFPASSPARCPSCPGYLEASHPLVKPD